MSAIFVPLSGDPALEYQSIVARVQSLEQTEQPLLQLPGQALLQLEQPPLQLVHTQHALQTHKSPAWAGADHCDGMFSPKNTAPAPPSAFLALPSRNSRRDSPFPLSPFPCFS